MRKFLQGQLHYITDVSRWRLCLGCGACAFACSSGAISLHDVPEKGIRPRLETEDCVHCGNCLKACPGLEYAQQQRTVKDPLLSSLKNHWGPVLELWEGHASDPGMRKGGSSGGAASAIALYCLESGLAGGVLHVGRNDEEPWRNQTVISTNRQQLLDRTGSRYSPASPCDGLSHIERASAPSVFMGKPCDIQGLRNAEALHPALSQKLVVSIGIFCAGTPATGGLLQLLDSLRVPLDEVEDIRFRGNGWPGDFTVMLKDGSEHPRKLSYEESWGFLQAFRPFRCYLCHDGTSELADISCGDPWYRKPGKNEPGRSLVLVRTEKGREILAGAMKAGHLQLEQVEPRVLELSQLNLLMKRRAIWGRLATMRAFGLPVPNYEGFPLFHNWLELPLREKARSIMGTAKRILQRKYYRPVV